MSHHLKTETETNEQQPNDNVQETVVEDPNSNVIREIVNPSWQPIGTTQSEPHVTQYDKNSVDWKEMLDAISYATGISSSDLIVWFIGNGGSPNHAVATVSKKDKTEHYKVFIEWVTNEGWKPTKVQQTKRNRAPSVTLYFFALKCTIALYRRCPFSNSCTSYDT
ncbi:hypothetical protein LR68_00266 [Anoxybacillus sp. BCO1]|nr:hypothetical protein LR68_00266 [Anoxybacillus sp. BCO1]